MKRWLATVLIFGVCSAVVRADITIVQTTTIEGGMAAMGGANMSPKITNRIKGMKSRSDIEMASFNVSSITDLVANQMIMLKHEDKTAQIIAGPGAAPTAPATTATVTLDSSVKPTGKSQVIDGITCDEYTLSTTMNMGEMTGGQMPPEAAEMMKDLHIVMKGSIWVAKSKDLPGGAEYIAFQSAMAKSGMAASAVKMTGVNIPGMDKMMKAMSSMEGMPYLTVMNMTIEGSGEMADMMRQMGAMKITTKVASISADPLSDDLFKVPGGYTVIK